MSNLGQFDTMEYERRHNVMQAVRDLIPGIFPEYSKAEMNALLKGLLFVQEMYDQERSSIDIIFKEEKEKYQFMLNIGEQTDTVVFQGSTAEGKDHDPLCTLKLETVKRMRPEDICVIFKYCN